jgi:hypothetical protein
MLSRHWKSGFQKNIKNDPFHVEEQLQTYDKDLYLLWNPETNEHLIMDDIMNTAVMRIPQKNFEVLDSRVVDYMKRIHVVSGFNASHEVKEMEERRLKEAERKHDDLVYNMGKDTHREVRSLAYSGG